MALFCRVVDNYGDAGVCWRLARQLAAEHGARVTLWIDRPRTLAAIAPAAGTTAGVALRRWDDAADLAGDDRVVISAFGCELPAPVRRRLAAPDAPLWLNLEYLSAEDWVEGCHGLASPKPADAVVEHFFYPGFTPATGGLLRERGLLQERNALQTGNAAARWLAAKGMDPAPGERRISLFCYPDAPLPAWLALLAAGPAPTRLLLPAGVAEDAVSALLGAPLPVGASARAGALALHRHPMLAQDDYDRLLWCCDLNFVRGEDSWVRAHWAARPFVWQPYPQDAATRRIKLDAFLARFAQAAGPIDEAAEMMRAWCGAEAATAAPAPSAPDTATPAITRAWPRFESALERLAPRYRAWCDRLAAQPDLASTLVDFCRKRL